MVVAPKNLPEAYRIQPHNTSSCPTNSQGPSQSPHGLQLLTRPCRQGKWPSLGLSSLRSIIDEGGVAFGNPEYTLDRRHCSCGEVFFELHDICTKR